MYLCNKLQARHHMRDNALSVANYFIELAQRDKKPIRLLGLVKRVYIAHGFSLALHDRPLIDTRFDHVEAWKYGPVIPSVYHSFKQYRNNPITQPTDVMEWDDKTYEPIFKTPILQDNTARSVVEMVWKRYLLYSDNEMVTITHRNGTPWSVCYVPDKNVIIPDEITALYYCRLVDIVKKKHNL